MQETIHILYIYIYTILQLNLKQMDNITSNPKTQIKARNRNNEILIN